ncbi:MAG: HD domain-containing protein [Bacteroidales bacterium]|nr:HD domain-containing protein [Bacteroidales bacterium]MCK9499467.1 HD domain-containing protein [Bacteroidales bacterium]MDY0315852.1 HD domain-containing protein [Bacteroidales bacterium]
MNNPFPKEFYKKRSKAWLPDVRGDFFRDQTAIIHSTVFRRLKNKTQVFFAPENDHICTRIEHVLHVATIAASICKGLNQYSHELDVEMAYAIGLGHDLGHTPFGHAGEKALNKILGGNNAFVHEINSYRQAEYLANKGNGLNLSYGVKDGIICHNGEKDEQYLEPTKTPNILDEIKNRKVVATSYEGCIMRFADKIAYLGRDIEDAFAAGFISEKDIPQDVKQALGNRNGQIINNLIIDIIENYKETDKIGFSDRTYEFVTKLKHFNYEYIYKHEKLQKYDMFCDSIIKSLFDYLMNLINKYAYDFHKYSLSEIELDLNFGNYLKDMFEFYDKSKDDNVQIVTDYIAGMTDVFALESIKQITIPKPIHFT